MVNGSGEVGVGGGGLAWNVLKGEEGVAAGRDGQELACEACRGSLVFHMW